MRPNRRLSSSNEGLDTPDIVEPKSFEIEKTKIAHTMESRAKEEIIESNHVAY
jgi:hypothetical protein